VQFSHAKPALVAAFFIAPSAAFACFQEPGSRPLIGCMPFNFSTLVDRVDYAFIERDLEGAGGAVDTAAILQEQDRRFPEARCYREGARQHVGLIRRIGDQLASGEQPNVFGAASAPGRSGIDAFDPLRLDIDAAYEIKDWPSEAIAEYYPALFAIIGEFEQCMWNVHDNGCPAENETCQILGFLQMGAFPNRSLYPPLAALPNFFEEGGDVAHNLLPEPNNEDVVASEACDEVTGFGDCREGGAFESDMALYEGFGEPLTENELDALNDSQVPQSLSPIEQLDLDNSPIGTSERLTLLDNFSPSSPLRNLRDLTFEEAMGGLRDGQFSFAELPEHLQKEVGAQLISELLQRSGSIGRLNSLVQNLPILGDYVGDLSDYLGDSAGGVVYDLLNSGFSDTRPQDEEGTRRD
jgi:hypothetical protein